MPSAASSRAAPADLSGHAFTIAPVPHGDGTYVFNGDGLVYRLDFGAAQVGLRSRVMRTPCYYADQATLGTSDGFRNQGGGPARLSSKLGVRNQVNTAFLAIGPDRLLVTYDAGRPFEIDPVTLEVVTAVGWNHEWHPALQSTGLLSSIMGSVFPLVQTSAHPVWDDRTRELFTLNFGNQGIQFVGVSVLGDTFTDLIRWDGQGALERFELVDDRGRKIRIAQSAHQIQVTQDYVLVMDCAFSMEMEKMINPHYLRPQLPDTIVYVVRRSDLQGAASGAKVLARRVVIPREAAHFVADYDNPGGRITMQVAHNCASDPSEWLMAQDREFGSGAPVRLDLAGLIPSPTDISYIGHHVIDGVSARWIPSQSFYIKDDGFSWGAALYTHRGVAAPGRFEDVYWSSTGFQAELLTSRIANTYANYTHRTVPMSQLPVGEGRPTALFRMSRILGGIADGYRFPDGRMGMSPQFVPRQGGSGGTTDGYVVCTVVSDDTSWAGSSGDEFWIFQASDLAR
ncbi:MAG: carotenoid oxygenase family protein, partial [Planctomycetota bacterium]